MKEPKQKNPELHINPIPIRIKEMLTGKILLFAGFTIAAIALLACSSQDNVAPIPSQPRTSTTAPQESTQHEIQIEESSRKSEYSEYIIEAKKDLLAGLPTISHPEIINTINNAQIIIVNQETFKRLISQGVNSNIELSDALTVKNVDGFSSKTYLKEDLIDYAKEYGTIKKIKHELIHHIQGFSTTGEIITTQINDTTYTFNPLGIVIETYAKKEQDGTFSNFSFTKTPESSIKVAIASSQVTEIIASILTSRGYKSDLPDYFFDGNGDPIYQNNISNNALFAAQGLSLNRNFRENLVKAYIEKDINSFLRILGESMYLGEGSRLSSNRSEVFNRAHTFLILALNSLGKDYPIPSNVLLHEVP